MFDSGYWSPSDAPSAARAPTWSAVAPGAPLPASGRAFTAAAPRCRPLDQVPALFRPIAARIRGRYGHLYRLPVVEFPDGSRTFHDGRLIRRHGLNVLLLRGDAVEMAFQHGRLLADQIPLGAPVHSARLVANVLANARGPRGALRRWINGALEEALIRRMLTTSVKSLSRVFGHTPAQDEGMALSEATGIPVTTLVYGLFNPELLLLLARLRGGAISWQGDESGGGHPACCCSSLAAWGEATQGGELLIGRNMDYPLNGTYDRYPTVVYYEPTDGGPRYMSFASAGVHNAGITAFNEAGLFLAAHTVPTTDAAVFGVPAFVTANEVIRRATTFDAAVDAFRRLPPASGWAYLLASVRERRLATLELSHGHFAVRSAAGQFHVQTNHYLAPSMRRWQLFLNRSMCDDARARQERMAELIRQAAGALDADAVLAILRDQTDPTVGRVRGLGNTVAMHTTLTSLVLDPARGRVLVSTSPGPAPHGDYLELPLVGTFDRDRYDWHTCRVWTDGAFGRAHPEMLSAVRWFIKAKIAWECDNDALRAYELLREVVRQDPDNPAYRFQLGIFALKVERRGEAIAAFDSMFQCPYLTEQLRRLGRYYRGRVWAQLGQSNSAQADLAAVLEDPQTDPKLRAAAAAALRRTQRYGSCPLGPRSLVILMQHSDMLQY